MKKPSRGFTACKEGAMDDKEKLVEYIKELLDEANEKQLRLLTIAAREIVRK